ncbi:MAG: alpha/beta hydrolase [Anaerolineales bacterium]|nr:alpha/beta hydrolase [Anaerolineales bacterium]
MSQQPVGYLISAVILSVGTVWALTRLRGGILGFISLYFGNTVNELPFFALLFLLFNTGLAAIQNDLNPVVGRIALGLSMLCAVGLIVVIRRAARAAPTIARALDHGIGPAWREYGAGANRLFQPRALLGPFFRRRGNVERTGNLRYGDAGKYNLLDVYRHRSRPDNCPVFIHFHAGGFTQGSKNSQALPLIYALASKGWLCISANYRLGRATAYPDALIDAKKVIHWVRAHAGEYGADLDAIIVAGGSAGGQMAIAAACTANDPRFQPGFESADTSVSAAIAFYGYYGWPLPPFPPDTPPLMVLHGDLDTAVPVEDARAFIHQARQESENPVLYAELPGAHHNFDLFHSIRSEAVIAGVEAFTAWLAVNDRATLFAEGNATGRQAAG